MSGVAIVTLGDARALQLPDSSVDLVVTSPPYWGQRDYQDGGQSVAHQIGAEATPQEYLENLWSVMRELWRVLKPGGNVFINLGDKRAGSGAPGTTSGLGGRPQGDRTEIRGTYNQASRFTTFGADRRTLDDHTVRDKSKLALPERFVIGCIDGRADPEGLGWIWRQDLIWWKLNGLPESVTDRHRDIHEFIFHLVKSEQYFSGIDELRETHAPASLERAGRKRNRLYAPENLGKANTLDPAASCNPLGKLPGSIWPMATEGMNLPEYFVEDDRGWRLWGPAGGPKAQREARHTLWHYAAKRLGEGYAGEIRIGEVDHYAAFPTELPRQLITGFAPTGVCTVCGQGRQPVTKKTGEEGRRPGGGKTYAAMGAQPGDHNTNLGAAALKLRTIVGYACGCNEPIGTPVGRNAGEALRDQTLELGRSGMNRERGAAEGRRMITRWEQRHHAEQLRNHPRRAQLEAEAGATAFAHYLRTDRGGARPIPPELLERWTARGDIAPVPAFVPPPTRPAVVLDPFGGTGTVAMVAAALGRVGISVDASRDYCRIAKWRIEESGHARKVTERAWADRQGVML